MGKLLGFPKERSQRVKGLQKKEAKRLFLSLSVLSVLVLAVTLGEKLNGANRPIYVLAGSPDRLSQINRAIASAQPYDLVEDLEWESSLASKLNHWERNPAAIGTQPSRIDELRFGPLAGKYRISEKSAAIQEIQYVESQDVTDRPVYLRDRIGFLQGYKDLLSVKFDDIKVSGEVQNQTEVYHLLDKSGKAVGRAAFLLDEKGRFVSLKLDSEN